MNAERYHSGQNIMDDHYELQSYKDPTKNSPNNILVTLKGMCCPRYNLKTMLENKLNTVQDNLYMTILIIDCM